VVGASFVNGGILPGDGALPLEYFHIGIIKKGLDRRGDLMDSGGEVGTIFFSGAEISGDDGRKFLSAAFAPFNHTGFHFLFSLMLVLK
jgi:hypothetical protein